MLENQESSISMQASKIWSDCRKDIQKLIDADDFSNFFNWGPIGATMFVNYETFTPHWFSELINTPYKQLLNEPTVWNPPHSSLYPCSNNRITQVYHLYNYEKYTKNLVESFDNIIEFGGGYGCLCDVIHKKGFKGNYTIFDFPELNTIQEKYLKLCGVPNVEVTSDVSVFKTKKNTLFISTFAISEAPFSVREEVFSNFKDFNYLIAYQQNFDSIVNEPFFSSFDGLKVSIPFQGTNSYLLK